MSTLVWHEAGDKIFQGGVDKGVLYLPEGNAVPWNGLIGVDEAPNSEHKSFFLDGVKYLGSVSPSDYQGKLKAYTYPDEFDEINGVISPASGLHFHEQLPKSFGLSYRTKIGNDLEGFDHGYKIHILYNVMATQDDVSSQTLDDSSAKPIEFSWNLMGTPVRFPGIRPMVHFSVDSTETDPEDLEALETILYGTEETPPRLPTVLEVALVFGYLGNLEIIDHGNGTWTATDIGTEEIPTYISMINETTFEIDHADVVILDPDTYTISDTEIGWP